jgi:hypothetical protein
MQSKYRSKELRPKLVRRKSEAQLVSEAKAIDHWYAMGFERPWISQQMIDDVIREQEQQHKASQKV